MPTNAQAKLRGAQMTNGKRMPTILRRLSLFLAVGSSLSLAACVTDQAPAPVARDLPAMPDRLMRAPSAPTLDTQCRFPWFGVAGCKGKDPNAMLRLTVSHDQETVKRLGASGAWYEGVRSDYKGAR